MQTLPHTHAPNRYTQGWDKLKDIDGEAGEKVKGHLKEVAPALGRCTIEFAFSDLYARSGLILRSREMATIAVLTVLGNAQPQLKMHIHRALDVGCTRTEVVEVILQVAGYVGFAAVSHSTTIAKEVFQERDARVNELNHA